MRTNNVKLSVSSSIVPFLSASIPLATLFFSVAAADDGGELIL